MKETANTDAVPPLRVGLTYNVKSGTKTDIEDEEAEYDSLETVLAIKQALEEEPCSVELLEANDQLPQKLLQSRPDIVFNIAEGRKGRGREAQVPAILNYYHIPFTGSDETTLCIALDKALTKRLLATYKIRTPKYRVISREHSRWNGAFALPAIVKPNAEGSSKGISDVAIAANTEELRTLLNRSLSQYRQDMLVEEYIDGREFTVGILGNGDDTLVFRPMEIVYLNKHSDYHIYSYQVKQNYKTLIRYDCPASISAQVEAEMMRTARKIYDALCCKDFARMDFRLSPEGKLYFIEINPLPGLAPGYSDYPMLADFTGMGYSELVRGVLKSALKRYGLTLPRR